VTWLAWRQFRAQAALAALALLAASMALTLTRHHVSSTDLASLSVGYESLRLLGTGLIGVPAFVGAFWGAPLLARELEAGTHRLAWTQSVTRHRWLATKLAVTALVAAVATAVFSAVFTWWSAPFDELGNRLGTANFGQRGIAPVAYTLFALALGTLLGAVTRRTLPAMAGTLLGFFAVRFAFQLLVRPRLVATVTASQPSELFGDQPGSTLTDGAWILSRRLVDASGHTVRVQDVDRLLQRACDLTRDSTMADNVGCVQRAGIHEIVRLHPASHFWALQGWEAAAFVAMAALLVLATFWWVRHRVA
jgi:hypothetical protein